MRFDKRDVWCRTPRLSGTAHAIPRATRTISTATGFRAGMPKKRSLMRQDSMPLPIRPTREERYAYIGATAAGRLLFVVYTERDNRIRIITAYGAEDDEIAEYEYCCDRFSSRAVRRRSM